MKGHTASAVTDVHQHKNNHIQNQQLSPSGDVTTTPEINSSDEEALIVTTKEAKTNQSSGGTRRVSNDIALDDPPTVSSPAPVPIKGGADEVIRVAHIKSIQVNRQEEETPTPRRIRPRKSSSPNKTTTKMLHGEPDNMSEDDEGFGAPMEVIDKSPYEPDSNAEAGVALFSDMKSLLAEYHNDDFRTVSPQATRIFGPTNAWCLVKANALIEKSGMVYSQEWVNGNIRGNLVGKLPNDMLILCFVSKRFVKAGDLLLSGLTRDLEIAKIIKEALEVWEMEAQYKKIAGTRKNYQFTAKRRDTYKCAIFVARVYSCYKAFGGKGELEPGVKANIKTCLDWMEERLPDPGASGKRKKTLKVAGDKPAEVVSSTDLGATDPPPLLKRKRGRPRKQSLPPLTPPTTTATPPVEPSTPKDTKMAASLEMPDVESEEDVVHAPSTKRQRRRSAAVTSQSNRQSATANGKKASLSKLIAQFEDQYQQMGETYQQMGTTLTQLKAKLQESRVASERDIRKELVLEIQETLMNTFVEGDGSISK